MPVHAFRGMSPVSQLIFSLFVILISFLFFMVVSIVVAIPLFHIDLGNVASLVDIRDPGNIPVMKYFQCIQSIGLFIVPPIFLAWLYQGDIASYLMVGEKPAARSVLMVMMLTIIISPTINYLGVVNEKMSFPSWMSGIENWMRVNEDKATSLTEAFLNVSSIGGLAFNLFMVALLPAIGEELLFRGLIQKIFTKMAKSHHWGIWISAILFSALHIQFYGFLPRLVLGVVFGYLLVWGGSLWLPMVAHFVNNAIAVLGMWMVQQGTIDPSVEEFGGSPGSFYGVVVSVVFSTTLLWYFWKQFQEGKTGVGA